MDDNKKIKGANCDLSFYVVRLDKHNLEEPLDFMEAQQAFDEMIADAPEGTIALGVNYFNAPPELYSHAVGSVDLAMYNNGKLTFPDTCKTDPVISRESIITVNAVNLLRERYGVELDDEYETIDFWHTVDENEELFAEGGKVSGVLWLTDGTYKALYERAGVLEATGISFDEVINEGDSYLYAYVDVKQDKDVTLTLALIAVDRPDTDHYAVPLKDEEKATLLQDVDRAAKCDGSSLDELLAKAANKDNPAPSKSAEKTTIEER